VDHALMLILVSLWDFFWFGLAFGMVPSCFFFAEATALGEKHGADVGENTASSDGDMSSAGDAGPPPVSGAA
jgi:hypothetical protein